ncbi:MAG TPA: hypothetical protein VK031_01935 [Tissierellaceae bacterium]|nr:hypothetical protein [Tissierellaceae bacterium]
MFKVALKIPVYLEKEGSQELAKLGIGVEGLGDIDYVYVWTLLECFDHELDGVTGTLFTTGSGGGLFSPLKIDNFIKMVDDHIEKYGRG